MNIILILVVDTFLGFVVANFKKDGGNHRPLFLFLFFSLICL